MILAIILNSLFLQMLLTHGIGQEAEVEGPEKSCHKTASLKNCYQEPLSMTSQLKHQQVTEGGITNYTTTTEYEGTK